jgi:DNA repair protein RadD
MIELRPYQSRTIEKLWAWFRRNPTGHPIVEVAVGGGKSILVAETIRQALEYPGARVLMCVASRELCKQNAERLLHLWPEAPVGIYSAGLKSRNLENRIIYATIGSIYKRWHQLGHIDLLLIDEAHNVSAKDRGMYRDMIRNLHQVCPNMRVIGWTGTAFHGNGVWLHDGDEPLFTDIAARVTMRELLDQGYLAPLVTPKTTTRLSADGVGTRGGDFIVSQLAKAIDKEDLVSACADELAVLGADRRRWFAFGSHSRTLPPHSGRSQSAWHFGRSHQRQYPTRRTRRASIGAQSRSASLHRQRGHHDHGH